MLASVKIFQFCDSLFVVIRISMFRFFMYFSDITMVSYRSTTSLLAILLLVNINQYYAASIYRNPYKDIFDTEADRTEVRAASNDEENQVDVGMTRSSDYPEKRNDKWVCAKMDGDRCVKFVRTGFWFGG